MIEITNVTKTFKTYKRFRKTEITAVKDFSAVIEEGIVTGLIGRNGAGKTTLIRLISTVLEPVQGSISIDGYDVKKNAIDVRKRIGVLFGGEAGLYGRLTAYENIEYFGLLNGLSKEECKESIDSLVSRFGMETYINRKVADFSRGMKQKVLFARAVVHNPQIIILDEPSTGLDIVGIQEVQKFIEDCQRNQKTIILSSHNMYEIENLATNILIIDKGQKVYDGSIKDIRKEYSEETLTEFYERITS